MATGAVSAGEGEGVTTAPPHAARSSTSASAVGLTIPRYRHGYASAVAARAALIIVALLLSIAPRPALALSETCEPGRPAISTVYLPNVTRTLGGKDGWDTPFVVQNVGDTPTEVDVSFYRFSDGSLVVCHRVLQLAPQSSFAEIPNYDNDLFDDTQYAVVLRAFDSTIVAVVNETRGAGDMTQSSSYVGVSSGARRVYLPNVTRHFYGYGVPFIVQNIGTQLSSVTAHFESFDGNQQYNESRLVMPSRSTVFDPDAIAALKDGTQYSVVVTSDQPVAVVANGHNEAVGPVAYAHNGLSVASPGLFAPYVARSGGSVRDDSPIVVQNVGIQDVDVDLKFVPLGATDPAGQAVTFKLLAIASLSSRVFDPRFSAKSGALCVAPSADCLPSGEYSLTLSANGLIAAIVLPTSPTTAAAYVAQPDVNVSSKIFLPNITRNLGGSAGWNTPFSLQSMNATNAILQWRRLSDGKVVKTESRRLVPGAAVWIDPRTVDGLTDDTIYSVVIQGEVAGSGSGRITAVVYERAAGGDSAMIYEGFPGF